MSALSQFTGGRRLAAIVNAFSGGGVSNSVYPTQGMKALASGALIANTLTTVLSIAGRGLVNVLGAGGIDATSRTIRLKVTIDGLVVFDATTNAITASSYGLMAIGYCGNAGGSAALPTFQPVRFNTSLLVQIASSVSETDKVVTAVNYEVDA